MLTSGVYSYLPLGLRVLSKIEHIIREEMNAAGAHELFMPAIHPLELWQQTGRDKTLEEVMIRFKNKKGASMCLGPTHEEIVTDLVAAFGQVLPDFPGRFTRSRPNSAMKPVPRFGVDAGMRVHHEGCL